MTTPDKRSRELKYYYSRRQRGDKLLRIWCDPETHRRFREMSLGETDEETFRLIVNKAREVMP